MLATLKQQVFEANALLSKYNLIVLTWGNVSGIDVASSLVVIKPSGIGYDLMRPEDMVVVDLEGKIVEGKMKPSSDTPTHLELYRNFQGIAGIAHTHSRWATIWSQSGKPIPVLGTTHADYFGGPVPCTRRMQKREIESDYELETGKLIVRTFNALNYQTVPGVLVQSHGSFTWGNEPQDAVHNAIVLEEIAMMAWHNMAMSGGRHTPIQQALIDKHYYRKHGSGAYYGQK